MYVLVCRILSVPLGRVLMTIKNVNKFYIRYYYLEEYGTNSIIPKQYVPSPWWSNCGSRLWIGLKLEQCSTYTLKRLHCIEQTNWNNFLAPVQGRSNVAGGVAPPAPDGGWGGACPSSLVRAGEERADRSHAMDRHSHRHGPPRHHHRQVPYVNDIRPDATHMPLLHHQRVTQGSFVFLTSDSEYEYSRPTVL